MSEHAEPVKPDPFVRLTERTALFQEAAAERLGINLTDLRCFALTYAEPGITASRLAELSGLTTGAITGVLDRLERARFVRREADPTDRRRTLVRALSDRAQEIIAVYDPIESAVAAIRGDLDAHQRAGLDTFISRAADAFEDATARMRASTRGGMIGEMFSAPLGDTTLGRLLFSSGAPRLSFRAAPLGPASEARVVAELAHSTLHLGGPVGDAELCRGTFSGPVPDIRTREGAVIVNYRRRLDWRQRDAHLSLSPVVPWSINIGGGLSAVVADLRGLRLRSLEIRGGTDRLELELPGPDGTSRVRITGGSTRVTLRHPAGTAVRLTVSGGAHGVRFGSRQLRDVHGELRLETPGATVAPDRYEIELSGGVRNLRVEPA